MEKDTVKDKVERYKILAEILFAEEKPVYIKNIYDNIYFANIVLIGENKITIDCFDPPEREGKRFYLYWINILKLDEYKENK